MSEMEAVQAWVASANDDLETVKGLLKLDRKHHALFFLHLAIEKLLKGVHQYLKHTPAPFVHDLYKLALECGLEVNEAEKLQLDEISTFNVSARYDIFKQQLYKKATPEFTEKWIKIGEDLFTKYLNIIK